MKIPNPAKTINDLFASQADEGADPTSAAEARAATLAASLKGDAGMVASSPAASDPMARSGDGFGRKPQP